MNYFKCHSFPPPSSGWLTAAGVVEFMISTYKHEDICWEFMEINQIHYYVSVPKQVPTLGINFLLTCTWVKNYTAEIWFLFSLTYLSSRWHNLYLSATNLRIPQVIRENQVLKSLICQGSSIKENLTNMVPEKMQQMCSQNHWNYSKCPDCSLPLLKVLSYYQYLVQTA